jgi:hypothetical protein
MNAEDEQKLLQLVRQLKQIDKNIVKTITTGDRPGELEEQFCRVRDEIKEILGDSMPLQIRDPDTRDVLKRVLAGTYFHVDKQERAIENIIKNNPQKIDHILRSLGMNLEEDKELKDDSAADALHWKLIEELTSMILAEDYFGRKKNFGTIIVASTLPAKVNGYFTETRDCFIFGHFYAAVGLCRVMIELSFRDKYHKLGPRKEVRAPKVSNIADPEKIMMMIREVCTRPRFASLKNEAGELYSTASDILHGREPTIKLDEAEVLKFIRRVFKLIEQLYDLG